MSEQRDRWIWAPEAIRGDLEALGFDVDLSDAHLAEAGGSLTARRDRGDRAQLIVVDAGGRVRVRLTVAVDEAATTAEIAGTTLRVVTQSRTIATATGTLSSAEQLRAIVAALDGLVPPSAASLPPPPRVDADRT